MEISEEDRIRDQIIWAARTKSGKAHGSGCLACGATSVVALVPGEDDAPVGLKRCTSHGIGGDCE